MAKMGRPLANNPKNKQIGVRMSSEEKEKLQRYAASHNMTMAEVFIFALKRLYEADTKI